MKKTAVILVVTGVLVGGFFLSKGKGVFRSGNDGVVSVHGHAFRVELADTDEKRALGLGGRDGLCDGCGMLFRFDAPGRYAFWMRGMRFPLDILWIRDGKIVFIEKNVVADFRGTIRPPIEADSVLEIDAGLSDRYGVREGDDVE